ncbi:hypothetical protein [uncultured Brevundimonas sp.]|uniref:hypothetical protein n=1 Tax=uncultured Brevundimonas sp. TaxID=213418 RepID=UPI0026014B9C|nr:hypothetical protein [uncultured Brevundimonas sp.]
MSDALIIAAPLAVLAACSVLRLAWDIARDGRHARDAVEREREAEAGSLLSEDGVLTFETAEETLELLPLSPEERERWLIRRFGVDGSRLLRALSRHPSNRGRRHPGAGVSPADREPGHG